MTAWPVLDLDDASFAPDRSCLWTSWDKEFNAAEWDAFDGQNNTQNASFLAAPGFVSPSCRAWGSVLPNGTAAPPLPGGIAGTGPMAIWSEALAQEADADGDPSWPCFVLSPLRNAMATNLDAPSAAPPAAPPAALSASSLTPLPSSSSSSSSSSARARFGIMGNATSVPGGFSTTVGLWLGSGINEAMAGWGEAARAASGGGKGGPDGAASARRADVTLQCVALARRSKNNAREFLP